MIVIAMSLLAAPAVSRAAEATIAVLGVEPIDVPDALAHQVTDALRQRAAATAGIKVLQGKDLVEIKMVFGCDGEAPACMAQAGRSLGADKLLFGSLKKAGGKNKDSSVVVALKLLDVKTQVVEKFVNETVNKREIAAGNVSGSAGKWFAALVEVDVRPTLTVTSDPVNAAVAIDGQPMGRTPITLRDLTAGAHTIAISHSGRITATRTVELRPGGTHEIAVSLDPEQGAPPVAKLPETRPNPLIGQPGVTPPTEKPVGHPGRTAKILALTTLAGAVVAGSVAIYTWRTYEDLQSAARNDLLMIRDQTANPTAEQRAFYDQPSCDIPQSFSGAPSFGSYNEKCDSGKTYTAATTALWVVAGGLAATSVILYVVGDRQAAKAKAEKKTAARLMQQSLRIAPVVSSQGGALSASFEF
jgi:hypothetical protein